MAPINPPQYLQAGSYTARSDRLMVASMMTPQHGSGALAVRSGVRPSPGGVALAVAQQVTPVMSVTVAAGSAWIQSPSASGGCYVCVNDAAYTVAVTTAHATLGRRDLIVARIFDAEISGAVNAWTLEIVTGTPASSPVVPAVPSGAISLATLVVAAAQSSITNANITDVRTFTTALGGTIPAPASSLPANPYSGMAAYDLTNLRPTWHNGTAWQSWMEDPTLRSQIIIRCTSGTRPSSPAQGWHIYETDTSRFLVYNGSSWVTEGGSFSSAYKTANETYNSGTFHSDAHLTVTVAANTKYFFDAFVAVKTPGSDNYTGFSWAFPSGSTMLWASHHLVNDGSPSSGGEGRYNAFMYDETRTINHWTVSGTGTAIYCKGTLNVSSTAGTFASRWNSQDGSGRTVLAGSFLRVTPI